MNKELKKLITTTILVVVAIVIDVLITVIPGLNLSMPMGGKFFGISLIPLVLIGLLFGLKYGLLGGFIYALYNFSFDYLIYLSTLQATLESWTGTPWSFWHIMALILFDYIIPFMAFGLSGLFKKNDLKLKNIVLSVTLVSIVRLISSSIAGVLLWGSSIQYAASAGDNNIATQIFSFVNNNLILYSLIYNIIYIFTTYIASLIIFSSIKNSLIIIYDKANQNTIDQ